MLVNFDSLKTILNGAKTYIDSENVQSNWNENDLNNKSYIKNKPFYSFIQNTKPVLNCKQTVNFYPGEVELYDFLDHVDMQYDLESTYTIKIGKNYECSNLQFFDGNDGYYYLGGMSENGDPDFNFVDYPFLFGYLPTNPQIHLYLKYDFWWSIRNEDALIEVINENTEEVIYLYNQNYHMTLDEWGREGAYGFSTPSVGCGYATIDGFQLQFTNGRLFNFNPNLKHLVKIDNTIYTVTVIVEDCLYCPILNDKNELIYTLAINNDGYSPQVWIEWEDPNTPVPQTVVIYSEKENIIKMPVKFQNQTDWESNTETGILNKPFGETTRLKDVILSNAYLEFWRPDDESQYIMTYAYHSDFYWNDFYEICYEINEPKVYLDIKVTNATTGKEFYNKKNLPFDLESGQYYDDKIFIAEDNYDETLIMLGGITSDDYYHVTMSIHLTYNKQLDPKYINIPEQVQSDWDCFNPNDKAYIYNKPFGEELVLTGQIQSYSTQYADNFYGTSGNYYYYRFSHSDLDNRIYNQQFAVTINGATYGPFTWTGSSFNYYISDDLYFYIRWNYISVYSTTKIDVNVSLDYCNLETIKIDPIYLPDLDSDDSTWNGYNMQIVTSLPASPDSNTFYFVLES